MRTLVALNLEQDIPDYDMDSADELWVNSQNKRLDLTWLKFEQMMDRLEKSSGQTVVTLNEAKALLKQDDEVSIAVYDYWLNKRLKTVRNRDFGLKFAMDFYWNIYLTATSAHPGREDREQGRNSSQFAVSRI